MAFLDILILIVLLSGGLIGAQNGFFRQTVVLIGTILCFVLAWFLKDYIADFLSFNLPFFKFSGLVSLNILLYQLIAFVVLFCFFAAVVVVLAKISGILEKILKMTIVLGIPSKILGFFVGLIEAYIIVFVVLFFVKQPIFNQELVEDSKLTPIIVNSSPGLSNIVSNMNKSLKDIYIINKEYEDNKDADATNKEIIDSLLKHKVITKDYVDKLIKKGKIVYEEEELYDKTI